VAWRGVAPCGVGRGMARRGERDGRMKGNAVACVCGVCGCVWRRGHALAACIGGGLTRSFVKGGSGGMVWVWLNVDVDGGGGSEGRGSRMKGKRRKKAGIVVGRIERRTHCDAVRKNCGAHSTLAQISKVFVIGMPACFRAQCVIPRYNIPVPH
jgi:hypothetical protein